MCFQGRVWAVCLKHYTAVQFSSVLWSTLLLWAMQKKAQAMLGLCPLPEREVQTRTPSTNINSPPQADAELCDWQDKLLVTARLL